MHLTVKSRAASVVATAFATGRQVGTGYSISELEDLNELLKDKWKSFDT